MESGKITVISRRTLSPTYNGKLPKAAIGWLLFHCKLHNSLLWSWTIWNFLRLCLRPLARVVQQSYDNITQIERVQKVDEMVSFSRQQGPHSYSNYILLFNTPISHPPWLGISTPLHTPKIPLHGNENNIAPT